MMTRPPRHLLPLALFAITVYIYLVFAVWFGNSKVKKMKKDIIEITSEKGQFAKYVDNKTPITKDKHNLNATRVPKYDFYKNNVTGELKSDLYWWQGSLHFDNLTAQYETKVANAFLKDYRRRCEQIVRALPAKSLIGFCHCVPSNLRGLYSVTLDDVNIKHLEKTHRELQPGGHWKPGNCIPRFRVAVIVPFRDRKRHLGIFLKYIHLILQRQQLEYRIFVVEQALPRRVFNKASMMNIGFLEATKLGSFDCVVFHDVDLIPEDDRNLYTCLIAPRHVGSYIDKFNYTICCGAIFGGATMFTVGQFKYINGFSNHYWGWGGEDDDIYLRMLRSGLTSHRYPKEVSRFKMIRHGIDKTNPENKDRQRGWRRRHKPYKNDGLHTVTYNIVQIENRALYTWIFASIQLPLKRKERSCTTHAATFSDHLSDLQTNKY